MTSSPNVFLPQALSCTSIEPSEPTTVGLPSGPVTRVLNTLCRANLFVDCSLIISGVSELIATLQTERTTEDLQLFSLYK